MATYYKYKSREGQDQVDWRTITKGITDEITRVKGDRDKKRKDIEDAAIVTFENLANKPQGPDVLENKNIASYAAQQEAMAREDLAGLRNGDLTLQQYTARTNTAQGGTKRLFNLSKKYQDNVQFQLDSLKPDENGIIQASGMNAIYKKMVERFADPSKSMYYVDPETRESFLAIVTDKEGDDVVQINDKAYSLMGVSAAEDIILRNDARYQSNSVSTLLKDEVGAFIKVLREGNVETKEDAYARMFDGKELTADGKAIMSQIKATFASDDDYSSMLFDTLGYVPVAENENGEGFTNLQTGETINKMPDNSFLVKTINGRQVPQIDDTLKDAAHRGVLAQIKSKLDIKETSTINKSMTDYQSAMLGLKRKELAKAQAEKIDSMRIQVRSMGDLYSGDQVNVKAATEYFRDINSTVSLVERIPGGVEVTYTNAEGATVKRPIVFGIENTNFDASKPEGPNNTRFNMVQNPNFNESQPEGPNNQKLIPEIKTQREFMISAGNLLIGADEAKKREFTEIVNSKNENGEFIFNETLSNENASSAAEITEAPKQQKFDIAFDTYLDEKLTNELFAESEEKVKESLTKAFADMGLKASEVGTGTSEVLITVPGYTGDPLNIDANNWTKGGRVTEKEKLKKYLRLVFKQRPDLSDTLKITDKEGNPVFFTPDTVKKTKGFG